MAVNGTVQWGNVNVPFNVYDSAVKAGQKYSIDPAILLAIGNFESGYRTDATNINPPIEASYGWLQFNRLAGNGSRQADPNFDVAALFDPYHSADIAAKGIRANLDKGQSLYDAISPWSVRDKALNLYQQNGQLAATRPSSAPTSALPTSKVAPASGASAATSGAAFEFPKLGLGAIGPFDLSIDSAPLFKVAMTVGAIVLLFVGVFKLTNADAVVKKVV